MGEPAMLASYSIIRSALNGVGVEDTCMERFMCEGGREAKMHGKIGQVIGEAGVELLGSWRKQSLYNGLSGVNCEKMYGSCRDYPPHYRNPGTTRQPSTENDSGRNFSYAQVEAVLRHLLESTQITELVRSLNK